MYDLGFPTDAIDAVRKLYELATTEADLPFGICTDKLPITHF
jgi:hypothetical protein